MNERVIERASVDFYNHGNTDVLASCLYRTDTKILDRASAYNAVIESAKLSLGNMVLDYKPDYSVLVYNDMGGKVDNPMSGLPNVLNLFELKDPIREVVDVTNWLYQIMRKAPLPYTLGDFYITEDGYFRRKVTLDEYNAVFENGLLGVYVNASFSELIPQLVEKSSIMTYQGKTYYKLQSGVGDVTQTRDTLFKLLKASKVRVYSTLPSAPFHVYDQNTSLLVRENLLTTVDINSVTTDILNRSFVTYEPPVFRHISLVGDHPIANFNVDMYIYYVNGYLARHTLRPGESMSLTVSFYPHNDPS